MINGIDAANTAKTFLGRPYEEIDCNRLIIETIRAAPGGEPSYRCAGTNWLWNSFTNRGKYQYIKTRDKIAVDFSNCGIGSIVLKYNESTGDCSHCGIYMGDGAVIHSPGKGKVVCETTIQKSGFNYVATSKFITPVFGDNHDYDGDKTGVTDYDTVLIARYLDNIEENIDNLRKELLQND